MAQKPRVSDIKFNKTLFRRHLISGWVAWGIGSAVSGAVTALGLWLTVARDWHIAVVIVPGVVFLYISVAGLLTGLDDLLEYRRIHVSKKYTEAEDPDPNMQPMTALATFAPDGELVFFVLCFALDRRSLVSETIITFGKGMTVEFLVHDVSVERWVYDEHGRSPNDGTAEQPGNSATWRGAFGDLAKFKRGIVSCFRGKLAEPIVSSKSGFSGKLSFPRLDEHGQVIEEDTVYSLALEEAADSLVIRLTAEPKKDKSQ